MNKKSCLKWVKRIFIWVSIVLLLKVLYWAIREWPVNPDKPYQKGFLFWGEKTFEGSNPLWVNNFIVWGIILFLIGFIITLIERNNKVWFSKHWKGLLVNFFCVPLEILTAAIIILVLFSGLNFFVKVKISLLVVSFILFMFTLYLRKEYPIK